MNSVTKRILQSFKIKGYYVWLQERACIRAVIYCALLFECVGFDLSAQESIVSRYDTGRHNEGKRVNCSLRKAQLGG